GPPEGRGARQLHRYPGNRSGNRTPQGAHQPPALSRHLRPQVQPAGQAANPSSKAVMFCLMDVSGSMTQATKDIAKRFFILLYLFLKRNYDRIEVVFIRHHTSAREVDEEEFFYSRETGGTIVSSALKLMQEIMADRYPANE